MERCKDRHCTRGAAALLFGLRRPGAVSPVLSSRPRTQPALCNRRAFSLPASLTKAALGWRAPGGSVEAIEPPVGGTPMKTPARCGLHPNQGAAVTQASPPLTQSKPKAVRWRTQPPSAPASLPRHRRRHSTGERPTFALHRWGQLTWRRPEPRLVGRDLSWWNRGIQHR